MKTAEKQTQKQESDVVKSDFIATLRDVNKGHSVFELSQALDTLVAKVRKSGKAGKLVYTLKVEPIKNTDHQVGVSDVIDLRLPTPDRFQSLFFATDDNRLTRTNPNQPDLPNMDV